MQGRRGGIIGWGYKELWADHKPEELDEGTCMIELSLAISFLVQRVCVGNFFVKVVVWVQV